jgi:hypothetical protein
VGRSAEASDPPATDDAPDGASAGDAEPSPSGEASGAGDDVAGRDVLLLDAAFEPLALRDPAAPEARALGLADEAASEEADSFASPGPDVSSDAVEPASPDPAFPVSALRPLPPRRRRRRFRAGDSPEAPTAVVGVVDGPASAGGAVIEVVNGSSLTCGPSLLGPRSAMGRAVVSERMPA